MMNKLLMLPLAILILCALFQITMGESPEYTWSLVQDDVEIDVPNGIGGEWEIKIIDKDWVSFDIDLYSPTSLIVLLGLAIGIGVLAGIRAVSSGLSDSAGALILNAIIFMGLWGVLSVASTPLFFDESMNLPDSEINIGLMLWMVLTICYSIGFIQEATGGD